MLHWNDGAMEDCLQVADSGCALACLSAHNSGSVVDVMASYVIIHYLSLFFWLCTGFVERNWDAFADTGSRHGRRTCEIQWHVGCNIENHTKGGFPRVV